MTGDSVTPRVLGDELKRAGITDVLVDVGSRARYSSDASRGLPSSG